MIETRTADRLQIWTSPSPCFWSCEQNARGARYQPRATAAALAGTYVTSFLIVLMWKEKAPLLSPDLLIAAPQQKVRWFLFTLQKKNLLNFLADNINLCADALHRMLGVDRVCVFSCAHQAFPGPRAVRAKVVLQTVWNMQRRHMEAWSASPLRRWTRSCPHKNKLVTWKSKEQQQPPPWEQPPLPSLLSLFIYLRTYMLHCHFHDVRGSSGVKVTMSFRSQASTTTRRWSKNKFWGTVQFSPERHIMMKIQSR